MCAGGATVMPRIGSGATVTDLYEAAMALGYLREGLTAPATFSLFARELPAERGFLVAAGLADVLDHLEGFAVDDADLADFAAGLGRPLAEVAPLRGLRFTGEVRAVPEEPSAQRTSAAHGRLASTQTVADEPSVCLSSGPSRSPATRSPSSVVSVRYGTTEGSGEVSARVVPQQPER